MHPPPINETCFSNSFFMCFLILDMLTVNKLIRTTGFEPLYLLYRQNFFPIFGGKKNIYGKNINGTNTEVTTQNVGTKKLYNVRFNLSKFDEKCVNKGHYVTTSCNHRWKAWHVVSVYDSLTYNGV